MAEFGVLNWTILIVYIVANLVLGFMLGRRVESPEDFYLSRGGIPWWAIGISVVATYVSALSFLGGPAWSYTDGLAVIAIHLNYPLVIVAVITFFLPFFYNSGVASIYEYQERRFGPTARGVMGIIFMMSQALGSAAILYATSLVLQFITGVDVIQAIVIVAIIALVYTIMGGIAAVIWTDVIQAGILLVGAVVIFFALLTNLPEPLVDTLSALKAEGRTNPLNFSLDPSRVATVWSGLIAMTLFHITVYGANQMIVQRALTARTIGDAKKSFLMMGFAAIFIYFLFFLLGILFYAYYQGQPFENGNTIILQFASDYGLPGLMGIIAAAVLAASMSSLDSSFNSLATISTVDFYEKYFAKGRSPEHYLFATRMFTLFWAVAIVVPAIMYSQSEGSILEILSKVGSWFVGAKLSMYGLGFFSRTTNERGLLVGVAVGFAAIWYVATYTDVAWPWYCLIGGVVNSSVALGASWLLGGRSQAESAYTVRGQMALFREQGLPETEEGWHRVPGRVDRASVVLLGFFVLTIIALWAFEAMIP